MCKVYCFKEGKKNGEWAQVRVVWCCVFVKWTIDLISMNLIKWRNCHLKTMDWLFCYLATCFLSKISMNIWARFSDELRKARLKSRKSSCVWKYFFKRSWRLKPTNNLKLLNKFKWEVKWSEVENCLLLPPQKNKNL
jgi:hypothetical protein